MQKPYIQKLVCEVVQKTRIKLRWDTIQEANNGMENAKT